MQNKGYLLKKLYDFPIEINNKPLQEYPRIQLKRDSYICLNGEWDYLISKNSEIPNEFNKDKIIVPYAVESPLSNVNHLLENNEFIYYHKKITFPDNFIKDQVFINFEAIDQTCFIYAFNKLIFVHDGGYSSFKVEVKDFIINNELDLVIKVQDLTDSSHYMRGKQSLNPKNFVYSSSSGIYMPVWMESVSANYVEKINYVTNLDEKNVTILINTEEKEEGKIFIDDHEYDFITNESFVIDLSSNLKIWSPESPVLYNIKIKLANDEVTSYFGLRKIEAKTDGIYLNNRKFIINGLLDQGYYYLGNLTPRSYEDYYNDLKNIKDLGFNCLRKHVKVEADLYYYYADILGILIIQDFPNGGSRYNIRTLLPGINYKIFNKEKYLTYNKFYRKDVYGRELFKIEAMNIYQKLYDFPSIICFTIFNEGRGEFDPSLFYKDFKNIDLNQHLFDTASGWYDTENSDLFSIHSYYFYNRKRKDPFKKRPYFLSETGGIGLIIKDHFKYDYLFGHRNVTTIEKFNQKFKNLYEKSIIPLISKGILCGVIYTQLNDCEVEANGIFTFDRKILKLDKNVLIDINSKINLMNK